MREKRPRRSCGSGHPTAGKQWIRDFFQVSLTTVLKRLAVFLVSTTTLRPSSWHAPRSCRNEAQKCHLTSMLTVDCVLECRSARRSAASWNRLVFGCRSSCSMLGTLRRCVARGLSSLVTGLTAIWHTVTCLGANLRLMRSPHGFCNSYCYHRFGASFITLLLHFWG